MPSGQHTELTRRTILKRGAILGGAVAWATPAVQLVGMNPALAQTPSFDLIFFDDFSQEPAEELNYDSFVHWDVSGGTVDLLDPNDVAKYGIPNGLSSTNYVDLDGSTGDAGVMTTKTAFLFSPGDYRLSFALAGNHRNGAGEAVTLLVANGLTLVGPQIFVRLQNDPFSTEVIDFTVGSSTSAKISFDHAGGDNIGLLLDFVKLEKLT